MEKIDIKQYIEKRLEDSVDKDGEYQRGRREELAHLFFYLGGDPLEYILQPVKQPEVDLERDAVSYCYDNGINISPRQAKGIARHFYELGKNARKEE